MGEGSQQYLEQMYLIVCKSSKALEFLKEEELIIGLWAEKGKPMTIGDAMVAKDELQEAGFEWGKDFYLKKD